MPGVRGSAIGVLALLAELEFNLPAQILLVPDTSLATEVDPGRCQVTVFAEFPKIPHAKGYEIVVRRTDLGNRETRYVAPPFERGPWQQRYPPPQGFERFFLGAYSTGEGCAAAYATAEGRAVLVSAKVRLDRRFERRFRDEQKPPYECERQGAVTTQDDGSDLRQNLATNRYAPAGTVIRTGRNAVVSIGTLDGESVLVGPGTTVRLTGDGLEVLERPSDPTWTVKRSGKRYRVRCRSHVISSRG